MPQVSKRLDSITESAIRKMTRISNQHGAIDLSQGFPDFDPTDELKEALIRTAYEGPHQYEITWGSQKFREALARKQTKFMEILIGPDSQIVVTCGSTETMMAAM